MALHRWDITLIVKVYLLLNQFVGSAIAGIQRPALKINQFSSFGVHHTNLQVPGECEEKS